MKLEYCWNKPSFTIDTVMRKELFGLITQKLHLLSTLSKVIFSVTGSCAIVLRFACAFNLHIT